MAQTEDQTTERTHKRPRTRSPNFPAISLDVAVERARALHEKEGRHRAPYDVVVKHWGYKPTSSSAMQAVGALNAYGLIRIEGKGKDRYIQLSERALQIIEDKRQESAERANAIEEAALAPPIHQDVWGVYGPANETSEENFETFLVREKDFNPKSASRFIAEYKATVAFAGLDSGDILNEEDGDAGGTGEGNDPASKLPPKEVRDFSAFYGPKSGGEAEKEGHGKNKEMQKGEKQFAIDLPGEGRVILHAPAQISGESIEFLKLWLERCWNTVRADGSQASGNENSNPSE